MKSNYEEELLPQKLSQYTSRKKRSGVPTVTNKGLWLRLHPYAARELHDYVLVKWYGGDRERLGSGAGLFRKELKLDVERWFLDKYPHIAQEYHNTFHRRLNGDHIVRRVRFMYVRYTENRKFDGRRSREYKDIIR